MAKGDLLADDAPVLKCAGGLMIEHPLVQAHVDRVDGSQDSVMGLDKDTVTELLGQLRRGFVTTDRKDDAGRKE